MTTEITAIIKGFKEFSEDPYQDTINFLEEYLEVEESDEALFELGKALFFKGDHDESVKCLNKSGDVRADAYLGLNCFKREDFKNAIMHFSEFLEKSENETVLNYLMLSYEKQTDWENAIKTGKRLLEINPKNSSVKLHLIDDHFNLEEFEKCIKCIDEMNDSKLEIKRGLALFRLKRYDDAIRTLEKIKTPESWELLSEIYEELEKPAKAIMYLNRSYESTGNVEMLFKISEIHCRNKRYESSIDAMERVLAEDPENERALERITKIYAETQNIHFMIEYGEKLLKVNEKNVTGYIALNRAYYLSSDRQKSMEIIERGLEMCPKSPELWIEKAWIVYPDDFEAFKRNFERGLELNPNNTKDFVKLIDKCIWEDEPDNARKYYERLVFYNPLFEKSFDDIVHDIESWKSLII